MGYTIGRKWLKLWEVVRRRQAYHGGWRVSYSSDVTTVKQRGKPRHVKREKRKKKREKEREESHLCDERGGNEEAVCYWPHRIIGQSYKMGCHVAAPGWPKWISLYPYISKITLISDNFAM